MAARRQPAAAAAAAASPAGLKIKVKAGVKVAAKEGGEEEGDGVVSARMLKRKRLTPPGSPASKRPPNTANGGSNLADLNAVNGKLTESVEHDEAVVQSQGELQVTKDVAEQTKAAADTADVVGDQSQSVATGVQVSSSQATSSLTNVAEEVMHHTIPSHAGWFSWTEIHTLEKRGLPEFFGGKVPGKTPEMYLEYRNTIMKKYREHLGTVLTVADMQEHLSGVDEKAIHRVMEFLDHWGLINYQAPAEFLPSWKHAGPVLESDAALMLRALPRKGSSLYHFDATHAPLPQQTLMANPKTTDAAVIAEMLAFGEGPEVEYHCNSCSADCSKQRYHCQKQADFDLCPNCYEQKQYGPDMAATDFIKMDVTEASNANGGGWTDQETLLLLEALELYGDNWNEIAEHVATKSKSQCILHFIRLPVEDSFTEDADGPAAVTNSAAPATTPISQTDSTLEGEQEDKETAEKAAPEDGAAAATVSSADNDEEEPWSRELVVPPNLAAFSEAGNPVMAQMAFLATMIGAKLGGEAAQSALAALVTKDPGVHLAAGTAMILEDPAVVDVERSSSENPDRSVQADEETQSGDEPAATGDAATAPAAAPSLSDGAKTPVPDSTASAQNDDDAPSQSEPNLAGKDVVKDDGKDFQKTESVPVTLDVMEEAKVAGRVKRAAASAIAAAAVKAKLLADQEEREMQRLIAGVIEQQQKKMELKLKFLNELEAAFGKECEQVERNRLNFFTDDARIAASHMGGSSHSNPPPSPPRLQQLQQLQHHQQHHQQQQQQHQHQAMVQAQQPPSQMMYQQQQQQQHGFHHQMPATQAAFMQSQMYQGLANSVNAGAMTMQLSHFGRQMMMQPPPHHMMLQQQQQQLQRPQEISPPQVNLGRAMMGSDPLPGMPQ